MKPGKRKLGPAQDVRSTLDGIHQGQLAKMGITMESLVGQISRGLEPDKAAEEIWNLF